MSLPALVVVASLLSAAPSSPSPNSAGPAKNVAHFPILEMEDQFARAQRVSDLRGEVVVLVFSDKAGAEASRTLGAKLHVHFHPSAAGQKPAVAAQAPPAPLPNWPPQLPTPDVKLIPIAVIGDVPDVLKPMVRGRFRQVSPDGVIWLDFTDAMRRQFQVVPDVPNVAVLDKRGQLRFTIAGNLEPQHVAQLVGVIDKLRREMPRTAAPSATSPPNPSAAPPARYPAVAREPLPTRVR
ncbi:MAG: hypothetical protein JNG90_17150 [Planctomycetaceae bacterium]|nr:hypothetical protein [Planctomycetaceae bacterium]